jgi:hypothetical protein
MEEKRSIDVDDLTVPLFIDSEKAEKVVRRVLSLGRSTSVVFNSLNFIVV